MKSASLRFFSVFLCCVLLLSSCVSPVVEPTLTENSSQPQSTQALTTEPAPKPDGKALYAAAVEKLKGSFVSATICVESRKAFGKDDTTTSTTTEVVYKDYLTERETMRAVTTMVNSDYKNESVYLDSVMYSAEDAGKYKQTVDVQTYQSQRIPVELFSWEMYAVAEALEQSDGGYRIQFSKPSRCEKYLSNDEFSLNSEEDGEDILGPVLVEGEARLDADGALKENWIRVSIQTGRFYYGYFIQVVLTEQEEVEVVAPVKAEEYLPLENYGFDPVAVMDQAVQHLLEAENALFTSASSHTATVWQASLQKETEYCFSTERSLASYEASVFATINGENATATYEECYRDGVLSYTEDGEEGREELSFSRLHNVRLNEWAQMLPLSDVSQIDAVSDADVAWRIDFTLDEQSQDALLEMNMAYFTQYSVQEILEMMELDSLLQVSAKGSLFVFKDSYAPFSLWLEYSATAPYLGEEYVFTSSYYFNFLSEYAAASDKILGDEAIDEDPGLSVTPPLYEVTGTDGGKLWLLGTIHVGDQRTDYLPKELYDAFDASDALAVEYNVVEFEKQLETDPALVEEYTKGLSYADGSKVKDHLSSETYDRLSVWSRMFGVREDAVLNAYFFYQYFSSRLSEIDPYLSAEDGVDRALISRAEQASKPVWNIESREFHVSTPGGFDDAVQQYLLEDLFETDSMEDQWTAKQYLFEAWCARDTEALEFSSGISRQLSDDPAEERYHSLMMTERNRGMHQKAIEYLESDQEVFFAVGAAHLFGEDGLVKTLTEAGYTVTPVDYASDK